MTAATYEWTEILPGSGDAIFQRLAADLKVTDGIDIEKALAEPWDFHTEVIQPRLEAFEAAKQAEADAKARRSAAAKRGAETRRRKREGLDTV